MKNPESLWYAAIRLRMLGYAIYMAMDEYTPYDFLAIKEGEGEVLRVITRSGRATADGKVYFPTKLPTGPTCDVVAVVYKTDLAFWPPIPGHENEVELSAATLSAIAAVTTEA